MKKITSLLLVLTLAVSATFTGCSKKESASAPEKVTFTYVTAPLNVPSIIEKDKSIFADVFGKESISVAYSEITSGAEQTQALASGDIQVLYAVGATSVILAAANGSDIKVTNMYSRSPKAFCLYAADDSISTPEDLRGKTIAGPAGTNLHELLVSYLATADMTLADVNYVNMSIPDAQAGLEGGSVDVALLAGATAYNAESAGYHLVTDGEGLINAIICVAVSESFYNRYPEITDLLNASQDQILSFMNENHDETMDIVAASLDLDRAAVEEMYTYYNFDTTLSDSDIAGFQATADFMYENDMIEEPFDVNTLFLQSK
ncbi:MAG: ABC transporter substrate-binding protein [Lachnospiraceae bacterium]|nr:ABC transporter substrate-binding protein [Lachnospiraceae bacterium]